MYLRSIWYIVAFVCLSMPYQACWGRSVQCVKQFIKAGLIGLVKLKQIHSGQEVTLLGEAHYDPSDVRVQEKEHKQFAVIQNYLIDREKKNTDEKLHVLVEQPFEVPEAQRQTLSPARSLVNEQCNPEYTNTEFENIEVRQYSGGGFLAFNKDLRYFNRVKRIAVGGIEYMMNSLNINDILNEYASLKRYVENKKHLFSPKQKQWVDQALHESEKAKSAFEKTVDRLGHPVTDTVLQVAESAENTPINKAILIDESYMLDDQKNVRPSLSLMVSRMVDPLYELYMYSRIVANDKTNHLVLTGATHSNVLKLLLEKNNFQEVKSTGSIKGAIAKPLLEEDHIKSVLS